MPKWGNRLARGRVAAVAGAALALAALARHRSESGIAVAAWSAGYATLLACAAAFVLGLAWWSWRRLRPDQARPGRVTAWPSFWVDVAVLAIGAAHLANALAEPATAARALGLNLVGSEYPASMVLEWIGLAGFLGAGLCLGPRVPPRLHNPAVLAAALAVAAVAGEGLARVTAILDPDIQAFPTNRAMMWHRRHAALNAAGFRDLERDALAEPGTHRLLVVGDSYAYGSGVDRTADRFGEQLASALADSTRSPWEPINAARPDTDTRQHGQFLRFGLRFHPEVVVLLYFFNDIDYLRPRSRPTALTEHPHTVAQRLHPVRLLFRNSLAFQELYARARAVGWLGHGGGADLYADSALVARHLADLEGFVSAARQGGAAVVAIVPFDIATVSSPEAQARYDRFVAAAGRAGLPIWSIEPAFRGHDLRDLAVNRIDPHPNELANELAARAVVRRVLGALGPSATALAVPRPPGSLAEGNP